ncbi:MAG: hypothetical protein AAB525_01345 [Patescibacteria group bacterium]
MKNKEISILTLNFMIAFLFLLLAIAPCVVAETSEELDVQRRAQIEKARKILAGTTWTVYTALQETKRPEEATEVFTFTERRVTTQNLANQGYGMDGSNYSVNYEPDGTLVWETMQKYKDGEGEVILRGDLRGDVMTGVIDIQPAKGARKIYYFTSQKEKPATAAVTSTTTSTTTETKK